MFDYKVPKQKHVDEACWFFARRYIFVRNGEQLCFVIVNWLRVRAERNDELPGVRPGRS